MTLGEHQLRRYFSCGHFTFSCSGATGITFCSRSWAMSSALNPSCARTSSLCSPCSGARRDGTLATPRRVIGLLTVYSRSAGTLDRYDDAGRAQLRILGGLLGRLDDAVGDAGLVENLFQVRQRLRAELGVEHVGQLRGVLADGLRVGEAGIGQKVGPPDGVGQCRPCRSPGRQHEPATFGALIRIGHRVHRLRCGHATRTACRRPGPPTPVFRSPTPPSPAARCRRWRPRPVRSRWYSAVVIAA